MEVPNIHIVPLTEIDQSIWTTLWQAYQAFYQADLLEQISENTWHKLTDSKREHMYGFAALIAGRVVGIVHVIGFIGLPIRIIWLHNNFIIKSRRRLVSFNIGRS